MSDPTAQEILDTIEELKKGNCYGPYEITIDPSFDPEEVRRYFSAKYDPPADEPTVVGE